MANPHHGDLDLARDKESSIWGLKLTKELRNDMGLASTYLLEPQLEEIKFNIFQYMFVHSKP